jgi:hypothetical protein
MAKPVDAQAVKSLSNAMARVNASPQAIAQSNSKFAVNT